MGYEVLIGFGPSLYVEAACVALTFLTAVSSVFLLVSEAPGDGRASMYVIPPHYDETTIRCKRCLRECPMEDNFCTDCGKALRPKMLWKNPITFSTPGDSWKCHLCGTTMPKTEESCTKCGVLQWNK